MDVPITRAMRRIIEIALAGEGELKGRILISETQDNESIRIGNRWFELDTREFGDFRTTIRQLEARGMIVPILENISWTANLTTDHRTEGGSSPPKN